mmetsp:Transcript_16505/g.46968  ORF Transcript_16505/g.46968 Transcript_16505/m.46968 type:complete len:156 (-) Transcript_16505:107-574(-)
MLHWVKSKRPPPRRCAGLPIIQIQQWSPRAADRLRDPTGTAIRTAEVLTVAAVRGAAAAVVVAAAPAAAAAAAVAAAASATPAAADKNTAEVVVTAAIQTVRRYGAAAETTEINKDKSAEAQVSLLQGNWLKFTTQHSSALLRVMSCFAMNDSPG